MVPLFSVVESRVSYRIWTKQAPAIRTARQEQLSFAAIQVRLARAIAKRVLDENSRLVSCYVLGIGTHGDPLSAAGALERDEFFVFAVHVPASLFAQSLGIKEDVGVSVSPCFCGIRSPPHLSLCGSWHLVSRQVAGLV
jgi:hypothetical protein